MIETVNLILILFTFVCFVAATRVKELVSAAFLLGAASFFLAVLWSVLYAPDVSFTEAMVGAGASTIFVLLALFGTRHSVAAQKKPGPFHWTALILTLTLGGLFLWLSADLPQLGSTVAPANQYLSPFYIENTYVTSKTPNAVTGVVVDYRAFDTLIESTVIFTAGVACLLVMKKGAKS